MITEWELPFRIQMKLIFDTLAYHECIKIQYNFRPTFSGFAYYSILSRELSRDFLFVKKTFDTQDQQQPRKPGSFTCARAPAQEYQSMFTYSGRLGNFFYF
jgi:hypothetical protein